MKALITTAEIIVALRTHFAIDENVDITFSHIAGHEGIVAIADTAPTFGQAVEEVKAIASETKSTRTRRSPVKASVETTDEDNGPEEKPATVKRGFGKKKVEEVEDVDQDTDSDDEGEVEQETVKPKRSFGKAKKAVEPEQGEDDIDQDQDQDDVEEEKPVSTKRSFGSKKPVKQETVEDDDADQDDGEAEEQPAKRTFGNRKTVFGKR